MIRPILQSNQPNFYSQGYQWYGWKLINGLAVLALLLAVASGAEADIKVYPGLMCVQHFPVLGPVENAVVQTGDFGEVLNTSSNTIAIVHCPIVRDAERSRYDALSVVVLDQNPNSNENIDCVVRSVLPEGNPSFLFAETIGFSNPPGEGNVSDVLQTFNFRRPTRVNPEGALFLRCIIPKQHEGRNSGIFSYAIDE